MPILTNKNRRIVSYFPRGTFGDGSNLAVDFTAGILAPFTLTRASSGTFLGSNGLVQTAANDVARFEFDSSGNSLGLKVEPAATNLLAHTEKLNGAQVSTEQVWAISYSATGFTGNATGPDGVANSATEIAPIAGSGTCIASVAMSSTAERNFSFYARRNSGSATLEVTLNNGSTYQAVTLTDSWQRFEIAYTSAAQRVGFRIPTNTVHQFWGCQLEAGRIPTSYIKNVSAAAGATRSIEYIECKDAAFSAWYTAGSPYTMLLKYTMKDPQSWAGATSDRAAVHLSAAGADPRTYLYAAYRRTSSTDTAIGRNIRVFETGTSPDLAIDPALSGMPTALNNTAIAIAVNTNDGAMCGVGTPVGTDVTCTLPNFTRITLGMIGSTAQLNGWLRLFKHWPLRLGNTTMQEIVL